MLCGADLLIIDDPHSEQDALSPSALDSAYEWYTSGPRQRLQPGGSIVIVMTRWSTIDLTAQLLKRQTEVHGGWFFPHEKGTDNADAQK